MPSRTMTHYANHPSGREREEARNSHDQRETEDESIVLPLSNTNSNDNGGQGGQGERTSSAEIQHILSDRRRNPAFDTAIETEVTEAPSGRSGRTESSLRPSLRSAISRPGVERPITRAQARRAAELSGNIPPISMDGCEGNSEQKVPFFPAAEGDVINENRSTAEMKPLGNKRCRRAERGGDERLWTSLDESCADEDTLNEYRELLRNADATETRQD